jgi:ABC-type polysaccharide/polyol phosphate export permease
MRDLKHLISVALQLWFYLTPVVYSYENSLSPYLHAHHLTWLYFVNPLTLVVLTFQRFFYVTTSVTTTAGTTLHLLPTWSLATFLELNAGILVVMIGLFLGALTIFGRLEGNFESEL